MKIIILGSGVIGTTSAYFLTRAGHDVTVIERQSGAGLETSFANAGEISPGLAAPWAAPGIPLRALQWLFMRDSPLVVRPTLDLAMWRWMAQMLANCNLQRYEINKARMVRLAEYSRDCLVALRKDTGIAYDERSKGTLQLFRNQRQVDDAAHDIAVLERYGVPHALLDVAGCEQVEPALALVRGRILGGLRLPGDETGDCFKFTQALAVLAAKKGVKFRNGVEIRSLTADGARISGVVTSEGELKADAFVMAMGSYSPLLLRPLGVTIPVYPVKGYSITMPLADPAGAPESTVMDETFKVGITRLGERIRVGGTAELAGYDMRLREERRAPLVRAVTDLFPHGGDLTKAIFWCGLRPMTPDGTPVIGATPYANLFLNTGHGTLGWTMSCGSARVLADIVSGREPDISLEGLSMARY
ncbi:D-amino acid dehydrogenase [Massilia sp. TWP1-3-3]|uniref:D-amino acid dehydrogenase n=1 Tax=Massilia sp. TWP1-3-3 TaxID=2804573 RepID=UPI003CED80AC